MASRDKYTFLTLSEFANWLVAVVDQMPVAVVLYRGPDAPLEPWDCRRDALAGVTRVYLAQGPVDFSGIQADQISTGSLGWVQLDVPRLKGRCLFASQIATKSDWFDAKRQKVMKNPAALRLFDRFWSIWKKHFMFPVWARNRKTGAEAAYRFIGYSKAAADWFQQGGELCQEGVNNIEFTIRLGASAASGP